MCGLCVLAVFTVFLFNLWAPNNYVKPVPAHIVEAHFTRSLIKLHVFFFVFFCFVWESLPSCSTISNFAFTASVKTVFLVI